MIFSLPFLLNFGARRASDHAVQLGRRRPTARLPSTGPSASAAAGAPSPQIYTVVSGDTIIEDRQAVRADHGASSLAANPQIKNANNIKLGDKITIPSAAPSDVITGASPSPS